MITTIKSVAQEANKKLRLKIRDSIAESCMKELRESKNSRITRGYIMGMVDKENKEKCNLGLTSEYASLPTHWQAEEKTEVYFNL